MADNGIENKMNKIAARAFKYAITSEKSSIKEAMRYIDNSGLRVAYIVNEYKKIVGVVSDSEIRRAILRGKDIREPVSGIINPNPVVLREKDLSNSYVVRRTTERLLEKMPDSQYILLLDKKDHPKRLLLCSDLVRPQLTKRIQKNNSKSILVVGGAGYLGSVMVRKFLSYGFKVKVLDILMYGIQPIEGLLDNDRFELIEGDMRNISTIVRTLVGVDAVVNLAAIVGDPACKDKPEAAIETNYLANKALAEACKYHQINRFIYASTCSVYGSMSGNKEFDENSPLNPISLYARSKIQSEEGILGLEDENFSPTVLRMGTLYGYSPRMRFDLVVNAMTKNAIINKKISLHGEGRQWRPLLHVADAAQAYIKCLEAPLHKIKGEIFNVGSREQNYQIFQIAKTIHKCIPGSKLFIEGESNDPRNYFVSFSKIHKVLKFKVSKGVREGVIEIKRAIEDRKIKDTQDRRYYNIEYNQ